MRALIVLLAVISCSPMHYVYPGVPNLTRVDAGVWRAGQITTVDGWRYVQNVTRARHLHVIKLNYDSEGSDAIATSLGIDVHYLPIQPQGDQDIWDDLLATFKHPDSAQLAEAERLLAGATTDDVWLVHCTHGQDRTGTVVGEHRVLHDGWTKERAYAEMLAHNFHPELHGLKETWEAFAP